MSLRSSSPIERMLDFTALKTTEGNSKFNPMLANRISEEKIAVLLRSWTKFELLRHTSHRMPPSQRYMTAQLV
jgi:hypothetical protein